jgi:hypothetical protein
VEFFQIIVLLFQTKWYSQKGFVRDFFKKFFVLFLLLLLLLLLFLLLLLLLLILFLFLLLFFLFLLFLLLFLCFLKFTPYIGGCLYKNLIASIARAKSGEALENASLFLN